MLVQDPLTGGSSRSRFLSGGGDGTSGYFQYTSRCSFLVRSGQFLLPLMHNGKEFSVFGMKRLKVCSPVQQCKDIFMGIVSRERHKHSA